MGARAFKVNIVCLPNTVHRFDFEVGNDVFNQYGPAPISEVSLKAEVVSDKHDTFIDANFIISGFVKLICARRLDPCEYPIKADRKLVFKYGDADQELSDEIVMIHR